MLQVDQGRVLEHGQQHPHLGRARGEAERRRAEPRHAQAPQLRFVHPHQLFINTIYLFSSRYCKYVFVNMCEFLSRTGTTWSPAWWSCRSQAPPSHSVFQRLSQYKQHTDSKQNKHKHKTSNHIYTQCRQYIHNNNNSTQFNRCFSGSVWRDASGPGVGEEQGNEKEEVLLRGVGTLRYMFILSENSACQVPIRAVAAWWFDAPRQKVVPRSRIPRITSHFSYG